jgi:hypothetical protein
MVLKWSGAYDYEHIGLSNGCATREHSDLLIIHSVSSKISCKWSA